MVSNSIAYPERFTGGTGCRGIPAGGSGLPPRGDLAATLPVVPGVAAQGSVVVAGFHDLAPTVEAVGTDVMAPMGFAGGLVHGQRGAAERIV